MARNQDNGPVTLSVLDRLIDDDPKNRSKSFTPTRAQSVRELKRALKRDLEWLLNTKRTIDPAAESASETVCSVYHYGFTDISSKSMLSDRDQGELVREMENTIANFEPRLKRVRVRMEPIEGNYPTLKFVIEGLLCMNPQPEAVRFDTVLEVGRGEYKIKGDDLA